MVGIIIPCPAQKAWPAPGTSRPGPCIFRPGLYFRHCVQAVPGFT
ncbi:TPA_asm: hypothetical protein HUJ06_031984 [Nelumbo nucifera]|uniref:Uncharacterized protein n=1 Tax=Nelumbo nucifera TaxID=4432 RepID=A0A822XJQ8_NELNU|nr:TPA_asm: hypothetical protein HUJ06_021406 [Nelumbo nucifera]DAD49550.1 TPA_asm: hypothetical protein HUJ06_031984 [Nelumbo nucifera]